MKFKMLLTAALVVIAFGATTVLAEEMDIAVNGSFETGDYDGWSQFPTGEEQFTIISPGSDGDYAACIYNDVDASAALLKNANIGIGQVEAGATVMVSFDARGSFGVGGVAFAEFFSELEGGGTSSSEILGGGPLMLDADPEVWTSFEFEVVTGEDVSGGVTVQFTATTSADAESFAQVYYDNLMVIIETPVGTEASTLSGIKTLFR